MATYTLHNNPKEPVPLVAFTLSGELVGHFVDMNDAAFRLKIGVGSIGMFLDGHQYRAGQYIFVKQCNYVEGMKITYESIKRKRKFLKGK